MQQTYSRREPENTGSAEPSVAVPDVQYGTLEIAAPDGAIASHQTWCAWQEDRLYMAVASGSVAHRHLEEIGHVSLLLDHPGSEGNPIKGTAVPVLFADEEALLLDRLAGHVPPESIFFRLVTEPLVPPEVLEDPAERRLLVQAVFSNLPEEITEAMADRLHYESFAAGAIVIEQSAPADRFFIIVAGQAEVLEVGGEGERLVTVLGPGESFGESALLLNIARTARIRARTSLRVLALDRHTFELVVLLSTEADAE